MCNRYHELVPCSASEAVHSCLCERSESGNCGRFTLEAASISVFVEIQDGPNSVLARAFLAFSEIGTESLRVFGTQTVGTYTVEG